MHCSSINYSLFPFCLTPEEVDDEPDKTACRRMPFYSEVTAWTNLCASSSKDNGTAHSVSRVSLPDIVVHFDGVVYMHGACDGRKENIKFRWDKTDTMYMKPIAKITSYHIFGQIKRNFKLCNNAEFEWLRKGPHIQNIHQNILHWFPSIRAG